MDRFSKVTDYLYRGGEPTSEDINMLREKYNIKKIISLDSEIGNNIHEACKKLKIKHIIFPLTDGKDASNVLLKEYILPLIENGGPTYIHCKHGKDRTGMAVAMFRILSGWPVEKALEEAESFGMGKGLPNGDTYYSAIRNSFKDENNSDIVELQRDNLEYNPGINNQQVPNFGQLSFAPYSDPDSDKVSRTAAKKIYRYCLPSEILKTKEYWFFSPDFAKYYKKDGEKLYSASIGVGAKVFNFENEEKASVYYSMTNDGDLVCFPNYCILLSVDGIVDISEEEDINNNVNVGLHDNYDGFSQYNFPGSGGSVFDYGGFAGPVSLPGNGTNL